MPGKAVARLRPAPAASRWRGKAWLLLTLPLGFTTWAAFAYVGIRARRARWLAWAVVYAATLAAYLALDTPSHPTNEAKTIAAALALLTWVGGGVHAFVISDDAVRRIAATADPAIADAETRIALRKEGRHLVATKPAIAREIGVGRPDKAGARDFGLIDINHCPAHALTGLPGVTTDLAQQIVARRTEVGGFSSVEDVGLVLDLPPATIDQMRDRAVFVPDAAGEDG